MCTPGIPPRSLSEEVAAGVADPHGDFVERCACEIDEALTNGLRVAAWPWGSTLIDDAETKEIIAQAAEKIAERAWMLA